MDHVIIPCSLSWAERNKEKEIKRKTSCWENDVGATVHCIAAAHGGRDHIITALFSSITATALLSLLKPTYSPFSA